MIRLSSSGKYPLELPEGHKFPAEKYQLTEDQLLYEGIISPEQIFYPDFPDDETLLLTHSKDYLEKIQNLSFSESEIRKIGFPCSPALRDRSLSSAGGTLACTRNALESGISINLAGGTHHAFYENGEGFCVLNDLAIASNYLLNSKKVKKILILDLDVHQGNGTASIFKSSEQVFTFSMHAKDNYPLKKEKSSLDIELKTGFEDKEYLQILQNEMNKIINQFQPDFIFYQSGTDIIAGDIFGKLNISPKGCFERDLFVFKTAHKHNIPIVSTMGGGYNQNLSVTVNAHVNTIKAGLYVFS